MPNSNLKENIIHINHHGTGNVIIAIPKTPKLKKKKSKKVTNAKKEN
jgi:hypothetical protein